MILTPFGREIRALRMRAKMSIRDLASHINKSPAYVGKIESQGEIPAPGLICQLAIELGTDIEQLLELAKSSILARTEHEINQRHVEALTAWKEHNGSQDAPHHQPQQEQRQMATIVSFINMKGGVGKTTIAMQIAHAADTADLRVLAVDLDPQANMSQSLLTPKGYVRHLHEDLPTVVQIFEGYVPSTRGTGAPSILNTEEVIVEGAGYWKNSTLDLIPSRLELSRTLKNPTGKERRLAKALAQVSDDYDLIIIDCAPTESILTDAAYFASRYVVVPIKPEFMATIGLPLLARSIREFQLENDDHTIEIAGLVFNHSSSYSTGPEGLQSIKEVNNIATEHEWHIFRNHIGYSASYAKAAREGTPISQTSYVRSKVASQFRALADELLGVIGLSKVAT